VVEPVETTISFFYSTGQGTPGSKSVESVFETIGGASSITKKPMHLGALAFIKGSNSYSGSRIKCFCFVRWA